MSSSSYPFRAWVRNTCRRAMVWGFGALALFGGVAWLLRDPSSGPLGRAFGVLLLYGVLFMATLLKIWYTAGGPAVSLDEDRLSYQPLHTFGTRSIELQSVLAVKPRGDTQSLGITFEYRKGRAREFFLNLAVVDGRHAFLTDLSRVLEGRGLRRIEGSRNTWSRADWDHEEAQLRAEA